MKTLLSLTLACATAVQCFAQTQFTYVGGTDVLPPAAVPQKKGALCIILMLATVGIGSTVVIWIYASSKNCDYCGGDTRLILEESYCKGPWTPIATNDMADPLPPSTNVWDVFRCELKQRKADPQYDPCLSSFRVTQIHPIPIE